MNILCVSSPEVILNASLRTNSFHKLNLNNLYLVGLGFCFNGKETEACLYPVLSISNSSVTNKLFYWSWLLFLKESEDIWYKSGFYNYDQNRNVSQQIFKTPITSLFINYLTDDNYLDHDKHRYHKTRYFLSDFP